MKLRLTAPIDTDLSGEALAAWLELVDMHIALDDSGLDQHLVGTLSAVADAARDARPTRDGVRAEATLEGDAVDLSGAGLANLARMLRDQLVAASLRTGPIVELTLSLTMNVDGASVEVPYMRAPDAAEECDET